MNITTNSIDQIKSLGIDIPGELEGFLESGHEELFDYCHEYADSSADVIYCAKSEALYADASIEERDNAEQMVEDCGGFGEGADMRRRFTVLAFWITYARIEAEIREQAEAVTYEMREVINNIYGIKSFLETRITSKCRGAPGMGQPTLGRMGGAAKA